MVCNWILYLRTSRKSQLNGIQAQQDAIDRFLATAGGQVVGRWVEQASGARNSRKALQGALAQCRETGSTLLVSKLDRLSRRMSFIALLMESDVKFRVAEFGENVSEFQLHIYAALSAMERKLISERTKAALQVVKRTKTLGRAVEESNKANAFAQSILPVIGDIRKSGAVTLKQISAALNDRKVPTYQGFGNWHESSVCRLLKRIR